MSKSSVTIGLLNNPPVFGCIFPLWLRPAIIWFSCFLAPSNLLLACEHKNLANTTQIVFFKIPLKA